MEVCCWFIVERSPVVLFSGSYPGCAASLLVLIYSVRSWLMASVLPIAH